MIKTAITIAAFDGRVNVSKEDILAAAELVLPHRMKRLPFDDRSFDVESVKEILFTPAVKEICHV